MVLPALPQAHADQWRARAVRPFLVQPRRCRAGDGVLALAPFTRGRESRRDCPAAIQSTSNTGGPVVAKAGASALGMELALADLTNAKAPLVTRGGDEREHVRAAIQLLASARIPARMTHGLHLTDRARDLQPRTWLEVHNTREWVPINPADGSVGYPANFLVWWYGDQDPLESSRARNAQVIFAVTRNFQSALDAAQQRALLLDSRIADFSLLGLPIQTHNMYRVLLMVPVGAMIIALLRNVVGFQTFGTFMPVLIALSFRETELLGGVILFTPIVSLGLAIRFYLEHLKLLLVPRLAAVVIVVVMLMLSIVSHHLGIEHGLAVALFPMVILAMTIERMSIVWEEHGAADAIRQGVGSMGAAIVGYLLMINPYLEHLIFVFPELLLLVLAVTLLLGRYTGYRLSELIRFRALSGRSGP